MLRQVYEEFVQRNAVVGELLWYRFWHREILDHPESSWHNACQNAIPKGEALDTTSISTGLETERGRIDEAIAAV